MSPRTVRGWFSYGALGFLRSVFGTVAVSRGMPMPNTAVKRDALKRAPYLGR